MSDARGPRTEAIAHAVIEGDHRAVANRVGEALAAGVPPVAVLEEGLIAGMRVVGVRFRENEIFVPEVLVAARAMKAGMELLDPILAASGIEPAGTVVLGTVKGDVHDIGKNLVAMMLRGAGFRVHDLGVDVSPPAFVEAVRERRPSLVGLSALLTTTMPAMGTTIAALRSEGLAVPVLVGGAPVSPGFAAEIGADGYGANASAAVERARELIVPRGPAAGDG